MASYYIGIFRYHLFIIVFAVNINHLIWYLLSVLVYTTYYNTYNNVQFCGKQVLQDGVIYLARRKVKRSMPRML